MNKSDTPKWKFVGGRLCLDFVNSVDARTEQKLKNSTVFTFRADKLSSYIELAEWAKEAGILEKRNTERLIHIAYQKERESKQVFKRSINLRESLFRVFKYIIEGWEPPRADIELVNQESTVARTRQELVYRSNKFEWNFKIKDDELDCMIWPIVLSSAELLSSEELSLVRQCPGPNCGWLFLDSSKNRSRQWCDMKDCGNLAKVRRYREKQK